jgi:hypothetical protein
MLSKQSDHLTDILYHVSLILALFVKGFQQNFSHEIGAGNVRGSRLAPKEQEICLKYAPFEMQKAQRKFVSGYEFSLCLLHFNIQGPKPFFGL